MTDEKSLHNQANGEFNQLVKATVGYIRSDSDKLWYMACPAPSENNRICNKKCLETGCPVHGLVHPEPRYIMSANISDHTGSTYITLFNTEAEVVMNAKASDLKAILDNHGGAHNNSELDEHGAQQWDARFKNRVYMTYLFTLKR